MLWPDGTCSQMGLQGTLNTSIITALQAMVNASNSAPAAALLNNRISSLGSAAGGGSSAAASQVILQDHHDGKHRHSHCAVQTAALLQRISSKAFAEHVLQDTLRKISNHLACLLEL
jgi:hypothetical protein